MNCSECNSLIEDGLIYKRNDINMFTGKPMVLRWYICSNENCGVNAPCPN